MDVREPIGLKPKGDLYFEIKDRTTGEIVDWFDDSNVVVDEHREALVRLIYEGLSDYQINTVKIGDDFGSGTINNPEPADASFTYSNMNELYSTDSSSYITINYDTPLSLIYIITLNGPDVVSDFATDEVVFCSMGLFSSNDTAFSYRRFPGRTITSNFDLIINWRLYYE